MDISEHVRFFKKNTPAFGEREFWECRLCKSTGGDEPVLKKTALQTAREHFDKVAVHFRAVAFIPPPKRDYDDLLKWFLDELSTYGQMGPKDAAVICSDMARAFYAGELKQRDDEIERLTQQVAELRASSVSS